MSITQYHDDPYHIKHAPFNGTQSFETSNINQIYDSLIDKNSFNYASSVFGGSTPCRLEFPKDDIFSKHDNIKTDDCKTEESFPWCWLEETKEPEPLPFISEFKSDQIDTSDLVIPKTKIEQEIYSKGSQFVENVSVNNSGKLVNCSPAYFDCFDENTQEYCQKTAHSEELLHSSFALENSTDQSVSTLVVPTVSFSDKKPTDGFKCENNFDSSSLDSILAISSDKLNSETDKSKISGICQATEDIFQQLMAEYNSQPLDTNNTGIPPVVPTSSPHTCPTDASVVMSLEQGTVSSRVTPSENILSRLTNELFKNGQSILPSVEPNSSNIVLQTFFQESKWKDASYFLTNPTGQSKAGSGLPPLPAPTIPSLPETLACKVKKENKCLVKFKKSYRRTACKETNGSYIDLIGIEEAGQHRYNTGVCKEDIGTEDFQQILEDPPLKSSNRRANTQQINVRVYKKIKTDIENDLQNMGNFSGFVVSDTSCFEKSSTVRTEERSPCEEINIGTLSSCRKLGQVRKVRTEDGDEVVIISPIPKYRMSSTKSRDRYATYSRAPLKIKEDNGRVEQSRACNSCNRIFKDGKGLVAHILKVHSR